MGEVIIRKADPDSGSPVYTLSVASQLSNIPAHSIRQYIDKGLLIQFKLDSKRHLFSKDDIRRLQHIQLLIHQKGFNMAGIRAMMAMLPCWAIRNCSESDRKSCNAHVEDSYPCRECVVYKKISREFSLKSVIRELI